MIITVNIKDYIVVDCPSCDYRHSLVDKLVSTRREFKCKRCGAEWDLCPDKETARQIEEDFKEIERCYRSLAFMADRYGHYYDKPSCIGTSGAMFKDAVEPHNPERK